MSVLLDTSLEDCFLRECRTIVGSTARMALGRYDVLLLGDRNIVVDVLEDAIEVLGPARVTGASPFEVPRAGGVEMTIVGERFRDVALIFLGAYELRGTRRTSPPGSSPGGQCGNKTICRSTRCR